MKKINILSSLAILTIPTIALFTSSCGKDEQNALLTFEKDGTTDNPDPTLTYAIEGTLESLHMQYKYDNGE